MKPQGIAITALILLICGLSAATLSSADLADMLNPTNDETFSMNSECVYDHIVLFTPTSPVFRTALNLTAGAIYRFEFETFTPFNPSFKFDCSLDSPEGLSYHISNYEIQIERQSELLFFEFGAAHTGSYEFIVNSQTQENQNVRVFVNGTGSVSDYFQTSAEGSMYKFDATTLDFYDVAVYTQYQHTQSYQIPMERDMEYIFNFFRVNPLVQQDCEQIGFVNPNVSMSLTIGGTEFVYWPEGKVQTNSYSLSSNIGGQSTGQLVDQNITMRFGSHVTANATISIDLDYGNSLPLNFAFLCFATKQVAANCSQQESAEKNENQTPDNETDADAYNGLGQNATSSIEKAFTSINGFFNEHFDETVISIIGLMGVVMSVKRVKAHREEKMNLTTTSDEEKSKN